MIDKQRKMNQLKKAERSSVLLAFLCALIIFPVSAFSLGAGTGFAWFLFCLLCMFLTHGFAAILLWPFSIIAIPWLTYVENKKRDLEIELKYGD